MLSNKRRNGIIKYMLFFSVVILIILVILIIVKGPDRINTGVRPSGSNNNREEDNTTADPFLLGNDIDRQYLTVSKYSRPGTPIGKVNAVVIHYVGNPGTTAWQNRQYFESLKDSQVTAASSHYIIGLNGEIIQCVPLDEISYCSNSRNSDTIAIECCHPDDTGQFNENTYRSLVRLTAALCRTYGLEPEKDLLRHYDITKKLCPLYYVENEDEWENFKMDVNASMSE